MLMRFPSHPLLPGSPLVRPGTSHMVQRSKKPITLAPWCTPVVDENYFPERVGELRPPTNPLIRTVGKMCSSQCGLPICWNEAKTCATKKQGICPCRLNSSPILGQQRVNEDFVVEGFRCPLAGTGYWLAVWLAGWLAGWLDGWLAGRLPGWLVGWLAGRLAGWLAAWLGEWLDGWLADCLAGWLAGRLAGWLAGWLAGCLAG